MKQIIYLGIFLLMYGTIFGQKYQRGYYKKNGTYVQPHYKTYQDNTNRNNYSTKSQVNPYTGKAGSKAKDYSPRAYNYGKNKSIETGAKGGQYYYNNKGNKTYVPKRVR